MAVRTIRYKNIEKPISWWSRNTGVSVDTIRRRIFTFGWSVKKALETPPNLYHTKRLSDDLPKSYLVKCKTCDSYRSVTYSYMMSNRLPKDCVMCRKVSYRGLHIRVRSIWGDHLKCELCGKKENRTGRKIIHWANKSGKYLLKREDWFGLCAKCHKGYDLKKIIIK